MGKESPKGLSFRNIIQYAGLTSEEYAGIKREFYESNWMILNVTLPLSFVVLLTYAAVSFYQGMAADICISYSIACICCMIGGIVNFKYGNVECRMCHFMHILFSIIKVSLKNNVSPKNRFTFVKKYDDDILHKIPFMIK